MMHRTFLCGFLLGLARVWAQDAQENLTSTTGPTFYEGETIVHTVTVGLVGHSFDPASLIANPGDKVMFKFYPGNHSFIESLYGWPCIPQAAVDGDEGINSGQFPNVEPDQPVVWNITINNTNPIWYYCGAPGSCINYGMLGAINPANASQVEAQQDLAKQSRYVLYPGDALPAAAAASISALAATVIPQYNANETAEDDGSGSEKDDLSSGAIAGIAIGSVAALAIIGILIFFLWRRRRQAKTSPSSAPAPAMQTVYAPEQPPAPPRQEMVVDGVTYVPAAPGTLSPHASYLPPYDRDSRFSHDLRSKSPESFSQAPYSPPLTMNSFPYPHSDAGYHTHGSYTETSELGIHAPQPRHEMYVEPSIPEHEQHDVERGTRQP